MEQTIARLRAQYQLCEEAVRLRFALRNAASARTRVDKRYFRLMTLVRKADDRIRRREEDFRAMLIAAGVQSMSEPVDWDRCLFIDKPIRVEANGDCLWA